MSLLPGNTVGIFPHEGNTVMAKKKITPVILV